MALAGLAKALILNTATNTRVSVMYNPEEFRLEQGNAFAEVAIPGLDAPPIQYVRGKGRALTMDLFFDTYETGADVRVYTGQVTGLLAKTPQTQGPPVLVFSMGQFQFLCVLADAGQRFTMFLRDGTPVLLDLVRSAFRSTSPPPKCRSSRASSPARRRCTISPRGRRSAAWPTITSATRRCGARSPSPTTSTTRGACRRAAPLIIPTRPR